MASLLGRQHEVRAPVLEPGLLVVAGGERELAAVADRPDALGGDAKRDHVISRCLSISFTSKCLASASSNLSMQTHYTL